MPALNQVLLGKCHVVAEVIKTIFIVGAVGDVAVVLLASHRGLLASNDAADGHSKRPVNTAHEIGLVAGEEVVHGNDVHSPAWDGI